MAKATITIEDTEDGVDIRYDAETQPPNELTRAESIASQLALLAVTALSSQGGGVTTLEINDENVLASDDPNLN